MKSLQSDRRTRTIWIDLENSPHVPFFAPIIEELRERGYPVLLTARDCFQVRELADLLRLPCRMVGRHPGKSNVRKMARLCLRALQLAWLTRAQEPVLGLSHGSRSQLMACGLLGIPAIFLRDYEFSTPLPFLRPAWLMCPEMIPSEKLQCDVRRVLKYPGIKEDVYARRFVPDPGIRAKLELQEKDVVVVLRPPASEAHYHNPEAEKLFDEAIRFLSARPDVKFVVLPRNERQAAEIRTRWLELFASGAMRIPQQVVDGVNLIWHSDLVISGGGTMNREAAALGVPVYSVFRGRIGAVDHYLSRRGRLVLLESAEDVRQKISLVRRHRSEKPAAAGDEALRTIVEHIISIMDSRWAPAQGNPAGTLGGLPSMGAEASRKFNSFESTKYF